MCHQNHKEITIKKHTTMKKIAEKIEKITSYINNKNYKKAFFEMYCACCEEEHINLPNGWNAVSRLMEERTHGHFLSACKILDETAEREQKKYLKVLKSSTVAEFVEKYRNWDSGYSMGETVSVKFVGNIVNCEILFEDRREVYRGTSKKWNNNIKYGYATLIVDISGSRIKTKTEIFKKGGRP